MNFEDMDMDLDGMLEGLKDFLNKMKDVDSKIISDRISYVQRDRWYHIQTGPHILSDNPNAYLTVIAVESFDQKNKSEPCGVEIYDSREEAIKGHDYWRRTMMDNPPNIFKDQCTGKIITIDF